MLAHLDDAVDALDQPSMDGINTYFVSWAVKRAGLKVALSGLGGDELFGGYSTFASGRKQFAWRRLEKTFRAEFAAQRRRLWDTPAQDAAMREKTCCAVEKFRRVAASILFCADALHAGPCGGAARNGCAGWK